MSIDQITIGPSGTPTGLPLVVCTSSPTPLERWLDDNRDQVSRYLIEAGAVLFRGFGVFDEHLFKPVADAATGDRLTYVYRSTPRHEIADRIYSATEYPSAYEIPLHNENSYQRDWPLRLLFCCTQPAAEGGATPLAATLRVTERIPDDIKAAFAARGVRYIRNYGHGVDLSWETVFQTTDRGEVEAFCRSQDIEFEWREKNRLRTWQTCQALAVHPVTGTRFWFNQAHLFHVSALDDKTRTALLKMLPAEDLPRHATYGDGGEIEAEVLARIRQAYEVEKIVFPWARGDVLLLDNMQFCHGRQPFKGPRKVLVSMADPYSAAMAAAQRAPGSEAVAARAAAHVM